MRGIVLIGASTGAPRTHDIYLRATPPSFAAPIVIIQHMPRGPFMEGFMRYLTQSVSVPCRFARNGDLLEPRHVYVGEPGSHVRFESSGQRLSVAPETGENHFAPSMNVAFASAAKVFGPRCFVAMLSGLHAHHDGLEGCRAVRRLGGRVLITDPATTNCYLMVKAVREAAEYDIEAPLHRVLTVFHDWMRS